MRVLTQHVSMDTDTDTRVSLSAACYNTGHDIHLVLLDGPGEVSFNYVSRTFPTRKRKGEGESTSRRSRRPCRYTFAVLFYI